MQQDFLRPTYDYNGSGQYASEENAPVNPLLPTEPMLAMSFSMDSLSLEAEDAKELLDGEGLLDGDLLINRKKLRDGETALDDESDPDSEQV